MLENTSSSPARAPRSRRATVATIAAGLVLGLAGAGAVVAATPAFAAEAAFATLAPVTAATPAAVAVSAGTATLGEVTDDARAAVGDARAALADAGALEADIAAAGLDLGVADTDVDLVPLLDATAGLADFSLMPVLILPGRTDELVDATRAVDQRVDALRDRLDAALEKKAAAEAKAKAEAAAKAKAKARAKAKAEAERALAAANTVEGAKSTAARLASADYGWGADQFSCLESLWTKESGWNYQAYNASSGATGIPQALPGSKMATAGGDWQTSATTQIRWGLQYIASAYGTPCSAWGHSQATNWY